MAFTRGFKIYNHDTNEYWGMLDETCTHYLPPDNVEQIVNAYIAIKSLNSNTTYNIRISAFDESINTTNDMILTVTTLEFPAPFLTVIETYMHGNKLQINNYNYYPETAVGFRIYDDANNIILETTELTAKEVLEPFYEWGNINHQHTHKLVVYDDENIESTPFTYTFTSPDFISQITNIKFNFQYNNDYVIIENNFNQKHNNNLLNQENIINQKHNNNYLENHYLNQQLHIDKLLYTISNLKSQITLNKTYNIYNKYAYYNVSITQFSYENILDNNYFSIAEYRQRLEINNVISQIPLKCGTSTYSLSFISSETRNQIITQKYYTIPNTKILSISSTQKQVDLINKIQNTITHQTYGYQQVIVSNERAIVEIFDILSFYVINNHKYNNTSSKTTITVPQKLAFPYYQYFKLSYKTVSSNIQQNTFRDYSMINRYIINITKTYGTLDNIEIIDLVYNRLLHEIQIRTEINKVRVICVGDSITAGATSDPAGGYDPAYGGNIESQYPYWLQLRLGSDYEVINSGTGRDTTYQVLARWQKDVLNYRPQFVIIMIGTNDIYYSSMWNIPVEEAVQNALFNVRLMVNSALENQIKPIIATQLPRNSFDDIHTNALRQYNEALKAMAYELNLDIIDFFELFDWKVNGISTGKFDPAWSQDGTHPSVAGYKRMAEYINLSIFDTFRAKIRLFNIDGTEEPEIRHNVYQLTLPKVNRLEVRYIPKILKNIGNSYGMYYLYKAADKENIMKFSKDGKTWYDTINGILAPNESQQIFIQLKLPATGRYKDLALEIFSRENRR